MSSNQEQQTRPVAIVTGASGGIGEATARALHAAGYRVFGTYRRPPATRSPGIEYLACDVTSDESVQTAVGQVMAATGRVDLLVNNAGVGLIAGAEESSLEQAKSLFDVNLFGVIRMTNAVLPTMRRQRRGRIVNISSIAGLLGIADRAAVALATHTLAATGVTWDDGGVYIGRLATRQAGTLRRCDMRKIKVLISAGQASASTQICTGSSFQALDSTSRIGSLLWGQSSKPS